MAAGQSAAVEHELAAHSQAVQPIVCDWVLQTVVGVDFATEFAMGAQMAADPRRACVAVVPSVVGVAVEGQAGAAAAVADCMWQLQAALERVAAVEVLAAVRQPTETVVAAVMLVEKAAGVRQWAQGPLCSLA